MPNLVQQADQLQGMPDDFLQQEAKQPSGMMPQYLVMAELARRQAMRSQQAQAPQSTVLDDLTKQAGGQPSMSMQTIDALSQTPQRGMNQPPPSVSNQAPPPQPVQMGLGSMAPQRMAGGGPVGRPDTNFLSGTARPGPYATTLPMLQEMQFQKWLRDNPGTPFDPGPRSDYDMRGFFRGQQTGADPRRDVNYVDHLQHYPDTYKTPYHQSFSNESRYATPNAPSWQGDRLTDRLGNVLVDETPVRRAQGGPIRLANGGPPKPGDPDYLEYWQNALNLSNIPPPPSPVMPTNLTPDQWPTATAKPAPTPPPGPLLRGGYPMPTAPELRQVTYNPTLAPIEKVDLDPYLAQVRATHQGEAQPLEDRIKELQQERAKVRQPRMGDVLIQTGLGIMASRNPTGLGALGEAGLGALQSYREMREKADTRSAAFADRLAELRMQAAKEAAADRRVDLTTAIGMQQSAQQMAVKQAELADTLEGRRLQANVANVGAENARLLQQYGIDAKMAEAMLPKTRTPEEQRQWEADKALEQRNAMELQEAKNRATLAALNHRDPVAALQAKLLHDQMSKDAINTQAQGMLSDQIRQVQKDDPDVLDIKDGKPVVNPYKVMAVAQRRLAGILADPTQFKDMDPNVRQRLGYAISAQRPSMFGKQEGEGENTLIQMLKPSGPQPGSPATGAANRTVSMTGTPPVGTTPAAPAAPSATSTALLGTSGIGTGISGLNLVGSAVNAMSPQSLISGMSGQRSVLTYDQIMENERLKRQGLPPRWREDGTLNQ